MKKFASVAILAAAAVALGGCTSASSSSGEGNLTHVSFGIGSPMGAGSAPFAVAEALGYFKEEGIDFEYVNFNDAAPILQGVASGELQLAGMPTEPMWQTMERGGDIQLVYSYIRAQTGSIAVLANSGINSLQDLRGASIGQSSLGSTNLLLSNAILAGAGLKENVDFNNVSVGTGAAALHALQTGQVRALSLWDTEYAGFESSGAKLRYFTTDQVASLFGNTFFTKGSTFKQNAGLIARFGRAVAKATLFTATNPEAALRLMYRQYPDTRLAGTSEDKQLAGDLVILKRRLEVLTAGDPQANHTWGGLTDGAVSNWVDYARQSGTIKSGIDANTHVNMSLVPDYNNFDADAVIAQAKAWTK